MSPVGYINPKHHGLFFLSLSITLLLLSFSRCVSSSTCEKPKLTLARTMCYSFLSPKKDAGVRTWLAASLLFSFPLFENY
jgi:hypothetical protein